MVKYIGPCIEDKPERILLAVKIRSQHFNDDLRVQASNCTDRFCKMIRSTVRKVVACNRRHDHMLQIHTPDRLCDPLMLIVLKGKWLSPAIMKVAVPWLQHSQRFGHCADSHTVCNRRSEISAFVEKKTGLEGSRTLIHSGFFAWCNDGSTFEQDICAWKLPLNVRKATGRRRTGEVNRSHDREQQRAEAGNIAA